MPLTPDELQLAKQGLDRIAAPMENLLKTLFGGGAREIGGMIEDSMRARRLGRLATKLLPRLQAQFEESGITPHAIPDNIWAPALEGASLVDDETLQDKWAALLVNASNPETAGSIQVCFVEILRQLSPVDAKFLDILLDRWKTTWPMFPGRPQRNLSIGPELSLQAIFFREVEHVPGLPDNVHLVEKSLSPDQLERFEVSLGNLLRAQLLQVITRTQFRDREIKLDNALRGGKVNVQLSHSERYGFTGLGLAFVQACRRSLPAERDAA